MFSFPNDSGMLPSKQFEERSIAVACFKAPTSLGSVPYNELIERSRYIILSRCNKLSGIVELNRFLDNQTYSSMVRFFFRDRALARFSLRGKEGTSEERRHLTDDEATSLLSYITQKNLCDQAKRVQE
jgi:hypothetical protein